MAGLKCAVVVAGSAALRARLATLPAEVQTRAGHLGVLAAIAAFREGRPWLRELLAHLDRNRRLLAALLATHLPTVGYVPPQASYLAWLDCTALGLGDDPAAYFLVHGWIALSRGLDFGANGAGFVRLNMGTSRALLEEAVRRMAAALRTRGSARGPSPPAACLLVSPWHALGVATTARRAGHARRVYGPSGVMTRVAGTPAVQTRWYAVLVVGRVPRDP